VADAAQRQRKLAAKSARRKAVVAGKRNLGALPTSLAGRIRIASKGRVVRCVMPAALFEVGIGHIVVARALPSGQLGCAWFLVDVFCLGVKDAFYAELGEKELLSRLAGQDGLQTFIDAEPSRVRKLIRDAAAYAAGLGLAAAKDTPVIEAIFGAIDVNACPETFTFGRDGKPFYVSGPFDTPARINLVNRTLQGRCGDGGWHYMIPADPDL